MSRRRRIETGVRKFSEEIQNFPNVSNYFYGPINRPIHRLPNLRKVWNTSRIGIDICTYIHCLCLTHSLAQSSRYEIRAWEEGDYVLLHGFRSRCCRRITKVKGKIFHKSNHHLQIFYGSAAISLDLRGSRLNSSSYLMSF